MLLGRVSCALVSDLSEANKLLKLAQRTESLALPIHIHRGEVACVGSPAAAQARMAAGGLAELKALVAQSHGAENYPNIVPPVPSQKGTTGVFASMSSKPLRNVCRRCRRERVPLGVLAAGVREVGPVSVPWWRVQLVQLVHAPYLLPLVNLVISKLPRLSSVRRRNHLLSPLDFREVLRCLRLLHE